MLATIPDILKPEELKQLREQLDKAEFKDGKLTARGPARDVKNNLQLTPTDDAGRKLGQLIVDALARSEQFRGMVMPRVFVPPLFARYGEGMTYGHHVDTPLMGAHPAIRTDVSCTVFLAEPDSYDGGELLIETMTGDEEVKLPAGHAVIYDSSTIHSVAPVTKGERVVAVTWAQSIIRNSLMRETLYDLAQVSQSVSRVAPESDEAITLSRSVSNLIRLVADP